MRGVLKEREKTEFGLALDTVGESLATVNAIAAPADPELNAFYQERLQGMESFFSTLDKMVAAFVALDNLRVSSFPSLFKKVTESES